MDTDAAPLGPTSPHPERSEPDRMRRAVWFLDVDGVLAPMRRKRRLPDGTPHHTDWRRIRDTHPVGGWLGDLHYSAAVASLIRRAHRGGEVEVRWLTTWEEEANQVLAPALGLPDLAWSRRHEWEGVGSAEQGHAPGPAWWKAQVIKEFLRTDDRAVLWCDDEITVRDAAHAEDDPSGRGFLGAWAAEYPLRLLTVSPGEDYGLTAADLQTITGWLRAAP